MADILFVKPDGKAPIRLEATPYDLESGSGHNSYRAYDLCVDDRWGSGVQ